MSDAPAATRAEWGVSDEAFRSLRSTVKFAGGDAPLRSVLVVDIDRDEPSGVAERLAQAFARAGDRCALVQTDVRKGSAAPGLTDLLGASASPADIARQADVPGMTVIAPGSVADPDLLAGDRLSDALSTLLQTQEYLILSCASLPRHADALAIAPRVDAVILVTTSGKTRRARAVEARDALERVGARMLGVVMVDTRKRKFW
jgi:Mrp family chromosome partitioning ATPase